MAVMAESDGRQSVLVVEDEESYQDALAVGLASEGFVVVGAKTLAGAREILLRSKPDIILLDIMLPDGSGVDFCREVFHSSRIPVIMVTARTSEVDVVLGLEIGAADYVTKPYRLRELVARMRAILRRPTSTGEEDFIVFGDLKMDFVRRSVTRSGADIELSRKEFDLLALFWGMQLSDTRTLDTHVKRLRQKIEVDPTQPRHLVTIRGVGFRLDG